MPACQINDDCHIAAGQVAAQFPLSRLFSDEVTELIFTTLLHDEAALVVLLTHAYTRRYIQYRNATAKSEGGQF